MKKRSQIHAFTQTPDSIASIVNMARNQDSSLRFLPKPKFVDNFYAADGGLADIQEKGTRAVKEFQYFKTT